MRLKTSTCFYLLFFFSFSGAQIVDLNLVYLGKEIGLSNSLFTCITQDEAGYIWIGTQDGLNRYDGYSIKVYKRNDQISNSLPNSYIRSIFTDSYGTVWIGTDKGLCKYNREIDGFEIVEIVDLDTPGVLPKITEIAENHSGKLFFSSAGILFTVNLSNKQMERFITLERGSIHALAFDLQDNIWIGALHDGGLLEYDYSGKFIQNFLPLENENSDLHAKSVHDLCFRGNELWIATEDDGIYKLDQRYNSLTKYPAPSSEELYTRSIYVDNDQRLWAIDHAGLKLYLDNEDRFYSYHDDNNDPFDVRKNATGIMQDQQGNYWTIHSPNGVGLSIKRKGFRYFTDNPNNTWHSSASNISALQEDAEGNLYIANPYNGIDIFYWSQNKTYRSFHNDGDPTSLGAGATFDLYWDNDGIWVATYFGGLQLMSSDFSNYTSYTNNPKDAKSIAGNDIRSVGYGANDNLWLSVHGKGVDRFSKKDNTFYHYTEKNSKLSSDWSFEVLEDSEGTVWVGTVYGLNRMLRDSSTFENYYSIPEDSSTLSDNEIVTVFEDSLKQIWVGTNSGLNLYNKEENIFFRVKGELGTAFISSIQCDGNNDLWLGTYNGLYRYTHTSGKSRKFDGLDGLPSNEFSPRASFKNIRNELFFGTLNGLLLFDPDKLVYNSIKPHVVISGLKLFGKEITDFENSTIIDRPISVAKSIHFNYNQNMISLEFMAINMIQPEKNQFAYILEPFDKEWHNVSTKREATYTNLDPGKYTFKVIASNNDDVWNYEGTSIEIIVKSPWWLSWWFRIIILVASATIIVGFFLLRTRQLRHQKQLLANKVRKGTNELRVANKQLKSKTDHLNETNTLLEERQQQILEQSEKLQELNTTKDRLFSIIAHDITNPFNSIMGFSELLNSTYNELNEEERRGMAGTIHESSSRVYGLLDNLLNWAKAQTNRIIFDPHLFDLEVLVKDALQVFSYMNEKKEIDLLIRNEKNTKAYVDEQMTTTILRNLISNAIKYTPNRGKITITIDQDDKHAYLSIKDTGIGMSEADCIGLFDLINASSKDGTDGEKGSGIGLILSRELIIKNNGELSVQSALGKGSTFKISLPLHG